MNQGNIVKEKINNLLDLGYKDKQEIFNKVVKELDVNRPTVRKLARELRIELVNKLAILEGSIGVTT